MNHMMFCLFLITCFFAASCKAQWTSFGSSNYNLCKSPQKWKNAKLICQHFGSKLVKIESEEENEFLKGKVCVVKVLTGLDFPTLIVNGSGNGQTEPD